MMEDLVASWLNRKEHAHEYYSEQRRLSNRCYIVSLLRDRMSKWCDGILDDLTLIDFEDVDYSKYRYWVNEMTKLINKCWRDIEVLLTSVYKDVCWLHEKVDISEPDLIELWWLMTEDVNKRFQRIDDFISRFYQLHGIFKEMVEVYSEVLSDESLVIFEKYKTY